MQIHYLEEFISIANRRSYARAAKELHVSQPVLSKHVQSLEKELHTTLFERDSHAVNLTPTGRILLSAAERILSIWESASEEIGQTKNANPVIVGGNTRSDYIRRLIAVASSAASSSIRLDNVASMPIVDALETGTIDLAFATLDHSLLQSIKNRRLQSMIVRKERLFVAMSASHELASCPKLSFGQISDWPLVRISQDYGADNAWNSIESLCAEFGFRPHSKLFFTDNETLHLDDELFLLPEGEVAKELDRMGPDVVAKPFSDAQATMDLHLVYRNGPLPLPVQEFIEAIIEATSSSPSPEVG